MVLLFFHWDLQPFAATFRAFQIENESRFPPPPKLGLIPPYLGKVLGGSWAARRIVLGDRRSWFVVDINLKFIDVCLCRLRRVSSAPLLKPILDVKRPPQRAFYLALRMVRVGASLPHF